MRCGRRSSERESALFEKLRGVVHAKLREMVRLNPSRLDLQEQYERLIAAYNEGARNVQESYEELVQFTQELTQEEQRAIAEELTDEELAVFDILTRPGPKLSAKERKEVKRMARELLTLKEQKLTLDWRKRQRSRAAVQIAIEDLVWGLPQECYSDEVCGVKSAAIYQHIYDNYWGAGQSVYEMAA